MKSSFGIIPSPSSSSPSIQQTLQEVLDTGHDLTNNNNFQGTNAGLGNTGTDVNAFGTNSAKNNTNNNVNAFGNGSAEGNSNVNVNAFGTQSAYNNTGGDVNAFGFNSAYQNEGSYVNAFGKYSAKNNLAINVNAFGNEAGIDNTGNGDVNFFGYQAGYGNVGNDVNGFGVNSVFNNSGSYINAFGFLSGAGNSGSYVNAFGYQSAYNNTGNNVNAFGNQAGKYNIFSDVHLFGYLAQADGNNQLVFSTDAGLNARISFNDITVDTDFGIQPLAVGHETDNDRVFSLNNTYTNISIDINDYFATNVGIYEVVTAQDAFGGFFRLPNPNFFNGQFIIIFNCDNSNSLMFGGDYLPYYGGSNSTIADMLSNQCFCLISDGGRWNLTPAL